MAPSRPRCLGREVHTATLAVAAVAQDPSAAVTALGTLGPRPGDSDHRVRQRQATAPPLRCVDAVGPWGSWLSRALPHNA